MIYLGNSKFRWRPMQRVLQALEPIREQVGRIALVGHGWDSLPPWAAYMRMEDAYYTDVPYLRKLDIEVLPPVPFNQVIGWMSKAIFNPVLSRPTFRHLRLVTPRFFETPAANTIPLFGLEEAYVQEIYGECALELVLMGDHAQEKILDVVRWPEHYADIVMGIRQQRSEEHTSELQSQSNLVCRLLLEKKKKTSEISASPTAALSPSARQAAHRAAAPAEKATPKSHRAPLSVTLTPRQRGTMERHVLAP